MHIGKGRDNGPDYASRVCTDSWISTSEDIQEETKKEGVEIFVILKFIQDLIK